MHTLPPETTTDDAARAETQRADTHRYRAATFDEAVALANRELGEHVDIVEANRIRRGGLGGFFATDLGVEIVVRPAAPARREPVLPIASLEGGSAIDRLLALVDAQERAGHKPAPTTDFGAALQRELRAPAPKPEQSSEDWSVEAYRRLAIPAHAAAPRPEPAPQIEPEPLAEIEPEPTLVVEAAAEPLVEHEPAIEPQVPAPVEPQEATATRAAARVPRPRRQAGGLAERVSQAAQAAAEHSAETVPAAPPFAPASPAEPATNQTVGLVTEAATALFSQLSNMPVVSGSQAANVRKLTVSVAGPAGSTIEISAELGA